jgi:hypothetical protein
MGGAQGCPAWTQRRVVRHPRTARSPGAGAPRDRSVRRLIDRLAVRTDARAVRRRTTSSSGTGHHVGVRMGAAQGCTAPAHREVARHWRTARSLSPSTHRSVVGPTEATPTVTVRSMISAATATMSGIHRWSRRRIRRADGPANPSEPKRRRPRYCGDKDVHRVASGASAGPGWVPVGLMWVTAGPIRCPSSGAGCHGGSSRSSRLPAVAGNKINQMALRPLAGLWSR